MTETLPDDRREEGEFILIDKPKGWTSFDVVNRLRRILRIKKIGHAGTLDPMATGLLIVCTGKKTKDLARFTGLHKEYVAEMHLGARTQSFDAETPVTRTCSLEGITVEGVREVLIGMQGPQLQIPPMYSAVKVGGERLYRLARRGTTVERPPRAIEVFSIDDVAIDLPVVRFRIRCSKGTYIRSLVNDIGDRLGCGAYLSGLVRTGIGEYRLDQAMPLEAIQARTASAREVHA
jgi:tRNA pseudouridine55 synthase